MVSLGGTPKIESRAIPTAVNLQACLLPLVCLLVCGCEDREIKVFNAPRDNPASSLASNAALPPPASLAAKPTWTTPSAWKELPPSGMRAASFNTGSPEVDVSVTTFPGPAGGLLENVNRWRNQIGLPPLGSADAIPTIVIDGQPAQIVELVSEKEGKTTLGALFIRTDQSWFIKLTGPTALALQEKENFQALSESFRFSKANAAQSTNEG